MNKAMAPMMIPMSAPLDRAVAVGEVIDVAEAEEDVEVNVTDVDVD